MVGLACLALACLVAVRWIVRTGGSAATANTPLRLADETLDGFDGGLVGRESVGRFRGTSGPSLREELAGIVHDDPDSAASVLRNWIGTAN